MPEPDIEWTTYSDYVDESFILAGSQMTEEKYIRSWIDRNISLRELKRQWVSLFKKDPPSLFIISDGKYIQDNIEEMFDLYPELRSVFINCPTCSLFRVAGNFNEVYYHPHSNGLEEPKLREICEYCSLNCVSWRDGTVHSVTEPRLTRYHGTSRERFYRGVDFNDASLIGLELETFINGDRRNLITSCYKLQDDYSQVVVEEDSSLSRTNGAEFIFKPTSFMELIARDSPVKKIIEKMRGFGTIGWDAGLNYGVHLNLNAYKMSNLHCAKLCYFINKNNDLCEIVGGRPESRYQEYLATRLSKHHHVSDNKYQAAVRRSEARVEIRIFRSSLMWERLRRYFEFADSVRNYTKMASARELSSTDGYVNYMKSQTNKFYREMRNLLGLNKNKKFPTKEHAFSVEE